MDVYIMKLFDETTPLPDACVAADPDLPYCQILGKYRIKLDQYNTIVPYDHMFENCAINFPHYQRDAGCWKSSSNSKQDQTLVCFKI